MNNPFYYQPSPECRAAADELTAWRTGKLVFNNATLVDVAREVSRYREQPLRVSTAAVGNLRLTSVFNSSDTDALLKRIRNRIGHYEYKKTI